MTGRSVAARLARLRAEGVITGAGRPLPRILHQIEGRGPLFSETIVEEPDDRI